VQPDADLSIYDDGVRPGWEVEERGGVMHLVQSEQTYSGAAACAVELKEDRRRSFYLSFRTDTLDVTGFRALRFAVHPGYAPLTEEGGVRVAMGGPAVDVVAAGLLDMHRHEWQLVELPLDSLQSRGVVTGPGMFTEPFKRGMTITWITISGWVAGTLYLDDVRLVAPPPPQPSAVTQARSTPRPEVFALHPSYPNPFNSSTVIRFSLPAPKEVELTVFNLAGQRIATLLSGVRSAGTHAVHWDGRDDAHRPLASGVYLYRLRTGDGCHEQTRKCVLVR
jgi:hypothetical protein